MDVLLSPWRRFESRRMLIGQPNRNGTKDGSEGDRGLDENRDRSTRGEEKKTALRNRFGPTKTLFIKLEHRSEDNVFIIDAPAPTRGSRSRESDPCLQMLDLSVGTS